LGRCHGHTLCQTGGHSTGGSDAQFLPEAQVKKGKDNQAFSGFKPENTCDVYVYIQSYTSLSFFFSYRNFWLGHSRLNMQNMFRLMARHGLPGFYYGIVASGLRCTVHTLSTYTLFYSLRDNKYVLMLKPYNTSTVLGLTGFWGGVMATPFAKLAVIRQADLTRSSYQRRK